MVYLHYPSSVIFFVYLFAPFSPLFTFVFASPVAFSVSSSTTFTRVDDSDSAIIYSPSWRSLEQGKVDDIICSSGGCFSSGLDPGRVNQGTWHEVTGSATVSYSFSGVGLIVYSVLPNDRTTTTSLTFLVDGAPVSTYFRQGAGLDDEGAWVYDTPVMEVTGLDNNPHTLQIVQDAGSRFVLDYMDVEALSEDILRTPPPTFLASTSTSTSTSSMRTSSVQTSSAPTPTPRAVSIPPVLNPTAPSMDIPQQPSPSQEGSSGVVGSEDKQRGLPAASVAAICICLIIVASAGVWVALYLKRSRGIGGEIEPFYRDTEPATKTSIATNRFTRFLSPPPSASTVYKLPEHLINSVHTLNDTNEPPPPSRINQYGVPSINVVKSYSSIPPSLTPSRFRITSAVVSATSKGKGSLILTDSGFGASDLDGQRTDFRGSRPLKVVNHSPSDSTTSTLVGQSDLAPSKELETPPSRTRRLYPAQLGPMLTVSVPSPVLSIDYSQTSLVDTPLASFLPPNHRATKPPPPPPKSAGLTPPSLPSSRCTSLASLRESNGARLSRWKEKATVMLGRREFFDFAYAFDATKGGSARASPQNPLRTQASSMKGARNSRQTFGNGA